MARPKSKMIMAALGLLILATLPLAVGARGTNFVVELAVYSMLAVSLNMLLSYTGLLSFGHGLFFGSGAYATALAINHIPGITLIPAMLLGVLAAGLVALICSPLLVRVSGTAFAMLTMAFGQLMYVLCLKFREITGGEDGITLFEMPPLAVPGLFSLDLTQPTTFYYVAMVVVTAGVWCMWHFGRTPLGGVQAGVRDNARRVEYLGFNVPLTKGIVFVVSGAFAGLAGSLFAIFQQVVSVDGFLHVMVSFMPIMAILLGGIGSFAGPIIGSGFLLLLEDLSMKLTDRVELVSGVVFILVVMFAPYGLGGLWTKARLIWLARRGRRLAKGGAA